jgi:hypothetical protein
MNARFPTAAETVAERLARLAREHDLTAWAEGERAIVRVPLAHGGRIVGHEHYTVGTVAELRDVLGY